MKTILLIRYLLLLSAFAALTTSSHSAGAAQASATKATAGEPQSLFITILDGEGALNDIRERTAREPIVQINDENHKPVAAALVLFSVDNPASGSPYATFSGVSTLNVQTDEAGRAVAKGFQIGHRRGQFTVHVKASKGQTTAEASFVETNVMSLLDHRGAEPSAHANIFANKKFDWLVGVAAAGGITAGVILASGKGPTTISTGTGTVGAPAAQPGIRIRFGHPGH